MTARVQNAGLARISATLLGLSWWLSWGTGSAAVATASNVAIPSSEARAVAVAAQTTTTVTNDTLALSATITAAGVRAITEVGGFDAVTGGNMDVYSDFAVINLSTGDAIAFVLNLRFA